MIKETPDDSFSSAAERIADGSTAAGMGRILLSTLSFATPPRERLYRKVRRTITQQSDGRGASQTMNPPLPEIVAQTSRVLERHLPDIHMRLSQTQQALMVSALYQFGDRNGVAARMRTPYGKIKSLHDSVIESSSDSPVSVSSQLDLALEQNDSLQGALWELFLTSRHFARMRDDKMLDGSPKSTSEKSTAQMVAWENALAGFKEYDSGGYRDAAGDTYYFWTHVLSRLAYSEPVSGQSATTQFYRYMFERGSKIMSLSTKLGKVSVLGTMSNHTVAGEYGNAVGDKMIDYLIKNRYRH